MTKDDDLPAASGRALPKRALAAPGRKTAPAGTPVNKLPADVPPAAVTPTSSRPPSGAQDTMSPPRTVGGHTARLFRGDLLDEDLDSPEPAQVSLPKPRVQDRSARGRAAAMDADDDEETVARIAAKVKPPPAGARGGTMRMDAADLPDGEGPPVVAAPRRAPPAAPPPPTPDPISEDPPSTARGGTGRALPSPVPAFAARPAPAAPPALAPAPATPLLATPPMPPVAMPLPGEISISGSEFEATALPPEEVESRWPFAFAVGAVSLAIGSLIPLPFRQYIVPARGPSASASASTSTSSGPAVAGADLLHPTAAPPHTASPMPPPALPSALAAVPSTGPAPTSSAPRPPAFGSVKVPRPNPTTPKDVF
jgi:hypothetical protein